MAEQDPSRAPAWLVALGGLGIALIGAGALWAVVIALENVSHIGV